MKKIQKNHILHIVFKISANHIVVVVKPLCFAFIFVPAILCLKLNVAAILVREGRGGVRVQVKNYQMQFLFCSGPRTTSNYSEPRSHESSVMNSCTEKQLFPWLRHQ